MNKDTAMKMLKSKLLNLKEKENKVDELISEGWKEEEIEVFLY